MRYCPVCGAVQAEDACFCYKCGNPLPDAPEEPVRDFWAERLQGGNGPREPASEQGENPPSPQPEQEDSGKKKKLSEEKQTSPQAFLEVPVKNRKNRRGWPLLLGIGGLVLAAALLWLSHLPKQPREPLPGAGMYYGIRCTSGDTAVSAGEDWVELSPDGTARAFLLGEGIRGSWTLLGRDLTLEGENTVLTGTLQAGVLTLNRDGIGYLLAARGSEPEALKALSAPEETEPASPYSLWEGDYYGWWTVTEGWGEWESLEGMAWDVCGQISLHSRDYGTLELWDSDCRPGERICVADLLFTPGAEPRGCLESRKGRFYQWEMEKGAWQAEPDAFGRPGLAALEGQAGDPKTGGLRYWIFLRPWGMTWEDMALAEPGTLPCADMLPPDYESWYLPLIAQEKPMPEFMAGKKQE